MKAALLVMFSLAASVGAFAKDYTTPFPAGANAPLVIRTGPLDKKLAGASMAIVPDTRFVIIQTKGGILLLGPLIGAAHIEAKTRALAKNSVGGYMGVDLPSIAALSLALIGADTQSKPDAFTIDPYAYVQQCGDDEQYRIAVALDVSGPAGRKAWHGRYVAHLAHSIPYAQFLNPSPAQVAAFTGELTAAMDAATRLMERDMRGELSAPGRTVTFGSLNLIGNKIGGAGIYTLAKDMAWNNVRLIEERDGNVVIRSKDSPSTLLYGMHVMARRQVHTLHD